MKGLGISYRNAEASSGTDFERLPAGGYVCSILKVEDHATEEKPYLRIVYDIREGEYANYYSDEWGKDNEWAHDSRHYYSDRAMGMFKGFLKAIDESNGTDFELQAETGFDEQRLVGKAIGYIIGEEEYEANDGSIKTRLRVRGTRSIQIIRQGKFKFPEIKRLEPSDPEPVNVPEPTPATDNDLPF